MSEYVHSSLITHQRLHFSLAQTDNHHDNQQENQRHHKGKQGDQVFGCTALQKEQQNARYKSDVEADMKAGPADLTVHMIQDHRQYQKYSIILMC